MKTLWKRKASWLVAPLLLLVACDSVDVSDEDDEVLVQPASSVSATFDATARWSTFGEDINSVGTQVFRFRSVRNGSGIMQILVRSEAIEATSTGLSSGDPYAHSWDGPNQNWTPISGPVGSERFISETIRLRNERTDVEAEGLVVTKVTIMPGGSVSFEVKEVISLP